MWRIQDPFRGGDNIIVMADAYEPPRDIDGKHTDMKPIPTNTRYACAEVMKKAEAEIPWFGIEQVNCELPWEVAHCSWASRDMLLIHKT